MQPAAAAAAATELDRTFLSHHSTATLNRRVDRLSAGLAHPRLRPVETWTTTQ